jgi:hypothetical protein
MRSSPGTPRPSQLAESPEIRTGVDDENFRHTTRKANNSWKSNIFLCNQLYDAWVTTSEYALWWTKRRSSVSEETHSQINKKSYNADGPNPNIWPVQWGSSWNGPVTRYSYDTSCERHTVARSFSFTFRWRVNVGPPTRRTSQVFRPCPVYLINFFSYPRALAYCI